MATIYNSDLFKEMASAGALQQAVDKIPNQLAEKVVPVMEVNPKLFRRINIIKQDDLQNATSSTTYTTPTDKDFFLTNLNFSYIKTNTATTAAIYVNLS